MKYLFLFLISTTTLFAAVKKPYRVFLKEGSILTKISDRTEVKITKGIYANVLETSPTRREHFIVYDKNGKPAYETDAQFINEIAEDIRILPNVDANVTYPAPVSNHSDDKVALLDTNFNLHLDNFQTSAFRDIYQSADSSVIAPRYELRTLVNTDLPVNFGLSVNFQPFSIKDSDNENVNFSILSFGPQLERILYSEETLALSVVGGGEFAPVYKAAGSTYTEEYKAMLLNIGIEGKWDTRFGLWSLGTHFRYHDLTLTETNRPGLETVPETITTSSIGVMAGYRYEWDL